MSIQTLKISIGMSPYFVNQLEGRKTSDIVRRVPISNPSVSGGSADVHIRGYYIIVTPSASRIWLN